MKICDEKQRKFEKDAVDWICRITSGILILFACIDIVRFAMLGDKTAFITFGVIAVASFCWLLRVEKQDAVFVSGDWSGGVVVF